MLARLMMMKREGSPGKDWRQIDYVYEARGGIIGF
jgi:hypothetical protein